MFSKKTIFIIGSLLIGLLLFLGTFKKIGLNKAWATVQDFSWQHFFLIVAISLLAVFFGMLRWNLILKKQGFCLSVKSLAESFLSGLSFDYLTPVSYVGGEPIKLILLREKNPQISFAKAIASISIDKGLHLSANLLVIVLGAFLLVWRFALPFYWQLAVLLVPASLFGIFVFLITHFAANKKFFAKFVKFFGLKLNHTAQKTEEEIHRIINLRDWGWWLICLVDLLFVSCNLFRYWLIAFFLGLPLSFSILLGIVALLFLVKIIPLPASLGGMEASQALAFSLIGFASTGLVFSLIVRLADLVSIVLGLFFLTRHNLINFYQGKIDSKAKNISQIIKHIFYEKFRIS